MGRLKSALSALVEVDGRRPWGSMPTDTSLCCRAVWVCRVTALLPECAGARIAVCCWKSLGLRGRLAGALGRGREPPRSGHCVEGESSEGGSVHRQEAHTESSSSLLNQRQWFWWRNCHLSLGQRARLPCLVLPDGVWS